MKHDFIRTGSYRCAACGPYISRKGGECHHTTVEYGRCMSDKDFGCEYKDETERLCSKQQGLDWRSQAILY